VNFWWLSNFARVGVERAAVEALARDEAWFVLTAWRINGYRLSADGVITAHGAEYLVRLIYPDAFPMAPAWVEPQDGETRWSRHQYGAGGILCLELRPDNWSPAATGADVLRSAHSLLSSENPLGDGDKGTVLSAHQIGDLQAYDWGREPVLVGEGCLKRIQQGEASDVLGLRWSAEDGVWPILVTDAQDRSSPRRPTGFDLGTMRFEIPVVLARAQAPASPPADRAGLAEALGVALDAETYPHALLALIIGAEGITPYHSPDTQQVYVRDGVKLPDEAEVRSGRSEAGASKTVAVIGVGSVGSKIAESLLRAGVFSQVLVDGDVLLPGNLERHTLDWRDVGFRKANAVRRRLLHIASGADIQVVASNLNWQKSAKTHASQLDKITACDLIVDATGDPATSLFLGALAADIGKPIVSVEVFEGGLGCLVARAIPGRDPSYGLGRAAYNAYCEQENVAPPQCGRRRYEAIAEDGAPVVADDAAVTIAAGHGARVVLDVLDGTVGEGEAAFLLLGIRKGWLFQHHGHSISLDVGAPPPAADVEDEDAQAFAMGLIKEVLGATTASE
jgi:molybdopterin/thiamine biosynthesis adenylyltransferase